MKFNAINVSNRTNNKKCLVKQSFMYRTTRNHDTFSFFLFLLILYNIKHNILRPRMYF